MYIRAHMLGEVEFDHVVRSRKGGAKRPLSAKRGKFGRTSRTFFL
jgi:hypothetical protein